MVEVDDLNRSLLVLCLLCCREYESNRELIFLSDNVGDIKRLIGAILSIPRQPVFQVWVTKSLLPVVPNHISMIEFVEFLRLERLPYFLHQPCGKCMDLVRRHTS